MALTDKLKAIADAIRSKTGSTESMSLDGMATEISNISTGGSIEEPYVIETYDSAGNLIEAELVGYTKIRNNFFSGCSKLALASLPSGVTSIGGYAFNDCSNLALTSLPSGITSIGNSTFKGCSKLALTSLPSGIIIIDSRAFSSCESLTFITFEGTPRSIASNAFVSCTNLTTINVPWAEGAVTNAPWGATNATINYNYTGE